MKNKILYCTIWVIFYVCGCFGIDYAANTCGIKTLILVTSVMMIYICGILYERYIH